MATTHQDDLDLLLSLEEDRVLETPPASPSSSTHRSKSPDYHSDHGGSPRHLPKADMSAFKDAVKDYLEDHQPNIVVNNAPKLNKPKNSNDVDVEKYSGLGIRNLLISPEDLSNHFADIRFLRLPAIRNLLFGDSTPGSWATAGVLTEKGNPKVSSNGKNYCIWKIGCLDENTISVFLFGDAYTKNCKEQTGTVFALFNSGLRKDNEGGGFSLSVFSADQILKMGTSVDFGVCKGKRKDGMACTMAINKRRGIYCKYHTSTTSQKYIVTRAELKGGNIKTAFRNPFSRSEGVYLVDPLSDAKNSKKAKQSLKVLSVDGLKKALSNAGKVTTNAHSQGIRFLTEVTGKMCPKESRKGSAVLNQQKDIKLNRISSSMKLASTITIKEQPASKRRKTAIKEQPASKRRKTEKDKEKVIELDFVTSDGDE